VGEKSNIFKARYLYGNCGRICGGNKCEGRVRYPGRSYDLPLATTIVRWWDGSSEVSRSHSRWPDPSLCICGGGGPLSGVLPYAAPAHPCAMAALGRPALRGTCTSLCNGISPAVDASLIRTTSAK